MTLRALAALLLVIGMYVAAAPYPRLRAQRLVLGNVLPVAQAVLGVRRARDRSFLHGFTFELPAALAPLRDAYQLDRLIADAPDDFEGQVRLLHWVRDRFPHGIPVHAPDPDAFDGLAVLRAYRDGGYLCGTVAPLLVQAITSVGGAARRVELRFTPEDSHVVAEAWSHRYGKWIVLDADYDVYFTVGGVPQGAIELHRLWAAGRVDDVEVHWRKSPHNIYRHEWETGDRSFIRQIYETRDFRRWDRERSEHRDARFAVRLLNYYTHVSFPLRNDWRTRPLPWWHPEGNHVQNSLVIQLPTMPEWEDFLERIPNPEPFYASPDPATGSSR